VHDFPWLTPLLVAVTLTGAWVFRRRAPGVALGLLGLLIGGFVGYRSSPGVRVPSHTAQGALIGLVVLGGFAVAPFNPLAGSRLLTPRAGRTFLLRASGCVMLLGILAVRVAGEFTALSCANLKKPWCGTYEFGGGAEGRVVFATAAGAVVLSCLFLVSATRTQLIERWRADRTAINTELDPP
jgi:hypothetical protein